MFRPSSVVNIFLHKQYSVYNFLKKRKDLNEIFFK